MTDGFYSLFNVANTAEPQMKNEIQKQVRSSVLLIIWITNL